MFEGMLVLQSVEELDLVPSEDELIEALEKMKMRKEGGKSGILPKFVAHAWWA